MKGYVVSKQDLAIEYLTFGRRVIEYGDVW